MLSRNTKHLNNICILHMRKCTTVAHTYPENSHTNGFIMQKKKYEVGWLVMMALCTLAHHSSVEKQKKQIFLKWFSSTTNIYIPWLRDNTQILFHVVTHDMNWSRSTVPYSLYTKCWDTTTYTFLFSKATAVQATVTWDWKKNMTEIHFLSHCTTFIL